MRPLFQPCVYLAARRSSGESAASASCCHTRSPGTAPCGAAQVQMAQLGMQHEPQKTLKHHSRHHDLKIDPPQNVLTECEDAPEGEEHLVTIDGQRVVEVALGVLAHDLEWVDGVGMLGLGGVGWVNLGERVGGVGACRGECGMGERGSGTLARSALPSFSIYSWCNQARAALLGWRIFLFAVSKEEAGEAGIEGRGGESFPIPAHIHVTQACRVSSL